MNPNDHKITWCLNWGEDAVSGWSACYCVSPDQERGLRELREFHGYKCDTCGDTTYERMV